MANWTDNQKKAIDIQDKNILVSASAGSGKTAVLVERVINKIINYKVDIDKIMVVTFTNAAANELKERLLLAIYKKIEEDPKNSFLKKQIRLLSRANITTMDAFCIKLVRSHFNVLNIDPNFKICDNSMSIILKNKAMAKILEQKYINSDIEDKNITLDLYKILEIFGGKDELLISSLYRIYGYIQSFPYPFDYLKECIEKYNIDEKCDLIETDFGQEIYNNVILNLKSVLKRTELLRQEVCEYDEFKRHVELLDDDITLLKGIINNGISWDSLYNILNNKNLASNLRNKVSNEELKEKIKEFRNTIIKKELDNAKVQIYETSEKIIKDNKIAYEYLIYLYDFLVKFDEEYRVLKEENICLEFDDVRHLALNLLVDKEASESGEYKCSDIAKELKNRFVEIYTDEYQDTNLLQETILTALSKDNNRFIVGDVKQSIYKFIQARPDMFNQKYDTYKNVCEENIKDEKIKNIKIILAENFRSRREVLDSTNYIFEQIMSKNVGDCEYSDIETLKNGATWYEKYENQDYTTDVEIVDVKLTDEEKENISNDETLSDILELKNFEKEAMKIAEKIKELKENFKVFDIKKSEKQPFRDLQYSDIVILLRSIRTKGIILEEILKKYDIPTFCDVSSSLFTSEELKLVLSFLKIIDNPYQDVEMISVMYSIIGMFSLDDLCDIRLFFKNKNISLYDNLQMYKKYYEENITKDKSKIIILEKIDDFLKLIEKFKEYSKVYSLSEFLIRLYKDTNIYYQVYINEQSDSKKSNLNLLIDIAKDFEKNNNSSIKTFLEYIDNISSSNSSESQAKVLGDNEDVVKIMTIHKSKGLEFPIVILADTSSKYMQKDIQDQVILHQKLGIGIDIVNSEYNISYPSVIKHAIKNVALREIKSEELRLLYVALTRAKEKLVITGNINDYEKYMSNQFVLYNDKKIDPTIILKNNSYISNILLAFKNYKKELNLFNINVTKFDQEKMNKIRIYDGKRENTSINDQKINLEKILNLNDDIARDSDIIQKLDSNLNYSYAYMDDVNTSNRVSVSKLKSEYVAHNNEENDVINLNNIINNEDEDEDVIFNDNYQDEEIEDKTKNCNEQIMNKFARPDCIKEEKNEYTPVRKGILIHFVLETLDFSKVNNINELKKYINEIQEEGIINENDIKYINVYKINKFLESSIGKSVKKSSSVYKEEEFVANLPKYSNSLIQGVIDLYYINENNNVVLVDFKTDRINKEEKFIEKYKIQLDIYKEAIEKLTGYIVEKKYIYSFYLDKEIEVK